MNQKNLSVAAALLAALALVVAVFGLLQDDGAIPAEQPRARGTTYFGNLSASGTLNADGATTLNSTLDVDGNVSSGTGAFTITDSANVTGAVDFDSTLNVDGVTTQGGALTVNDNLVVTGTGRIDEAVNLNSTVDIDGNITSGTGSITMTDNVLVDGQADAVQLTVQGYTTQTNSLAVLEQSDGTDKLTVSNEGHTVVSGERDAATGYDYFFTVEGSATGVQNGAKTYGLYVEMDRPAGYESAGGDLDDAGIKVRVETEAVTTTAGTTLRAIDAEAKADNPSGTVTNLYGGLFTAKSDTSAGDVSVMVGLNANTQNNAAVTDYLASADIRLMRQAATEPTEEYIMEVRNSSTSGSGADAGIFLNSDYGSSATTDSMDYGVDMASAAVNTADIRLSNGETIANTTDTAIQFGGFVAMTEGAVIDLGATFTITPAASYQPITNSTGGSITSSLTTAIADGPVAGALLVICNEDAQDIVIADNANTLLGGNVTLTGGAQDCLTVLWNGADWVGLAMHDN